jgi:FAD-dependent halogenase
VETSVTKFDAIVIGGGPGGSTAATLIAMQGHQVLLLEREALPIYKIGESLLPSTIHGICPMLGVSEDLKKANFVHKQGGTFRWGKNKEPWTFAFSQSSRFQAPTSYAYQVERMKFDTILLDNAKRKGVDVRQQHTVVDLITERGRITGVEFLDHDGHQNIARSRYVVDASGHTSSSAKHAGERIYSEFFRNVALFGYYQNGKRLPPPCAGNIFCAAFDKGWFWYIPLSPTLTSVGAVIGQEHSQILQKGYAAALSELVGCCGPVKELLSEATRITDGPYGEVRVRKDYSYSHSKFWRPGLALVGDAACFIDPVFSSGVHLATYSGLLAARSINSCLSNLIDEEKSFNEFENRYRREFRYFYDFLIAFYDMDQDLDAYYWAARKVVNTAESNNEAFIQLVAGIASGDGLDAPAEQFIKAREGIGRRLFPSADGMSPNMYLETLKEDADREHFMAGLTAESSQMQLRGGTPNVRIFEKPLFREGLVPSLDGFHWAEARLARL